jgi:hypothetical protein
MEPLSPQAGEACLLHWGDIGPPWGRAAPFGTMKARMGATHFLMKTLPKVATEGAACARLQSHVGDEYHWHQAADGSDRRMSGRSHRFLLPMRQAKPSGAASGLPNALPCEKSSKTAILEKFARQELSETPTKRFHAAWTRSRHGRYYEPTTRVKPNC